ncbi:DUF3034 family protein [Wenzhouxiangella marina]|uniref:Uncharacterized protein n=1 Tax=Wenzhouxiangella marina TaxID=1579979 RepID=A0A0K0XZY6_9GAMM|nr:DUF3034 family protein [Wenzhouxiangella marina]AKS43253.1 hypothetical protein WM2015_2896 [Wenzhouxiangella marina]MBB6087060.1 hypothetical protein [Wenzhouxiangella marina]
MKHAIAILAGLGLGLIFLPSAEAAGGRLLATGGVSQFEGAAGGGLSPWALITGYGTEDEIGGAAHYTYLHTDRYGLQSAGFKFGLFDRFEFGYTRQRLNVDSFVIQSTAGALIGGLEPLLGPADPGVASNALIDMDIYHAKLRLFGDAVYAQDSWLPQVSLGIQHKRNRDFGGGVDLPYLGEVGIPALLGARDSHGTDVYLSASKVLLGVPFGRNLLLNGTVRATRANAFGLLGFGREVINPLTGERLDLNDGHELEFELSAALFLTPTVVLGGEYRTQSNRLADQPVLGLLGAPDLAEENDAWDLFLAWFPNKTLAVTAAYVDLGNLPFQPDSEAAYLSLQASF